MTALLEAPSKRAYDAARYAANREQILARRAAYRAANPEKIAAQKAASYLAHRAQILAQQARYRAANPEKYAARDAAYAIANRKKIAARRAAYQRAYPEKVALRGHRRRARKLGNGIFIRSTRDRRRQLARQHHECFYCHDPLKPGRGTHEEHVVPLSRGGRDSVGNVVYACAACNLQKGDRTVMEWRLSQLRRKVAA